MTTHAHTYICIANSHKLSLTTTKMHIKKWSENEWMPHFKRALFPGLSHLFIMNIKIWMTAYQRDPSKKKKNTGVDVSSTHIRWNWIGWAVVSGFWKVMHPLQIRFISINSTYIPIWKAFIALFRRVHILLILTWKYATISIDCSIAVIVKFFGDNTLPAKLNVCVCIFNSLFNWLLNSLLNLKCCIFHMHMSTVET